MAACLLQQGTSADHRNYAVLRPQVGAGTIHVRVVTKPISVGKLKQLLDEAVLDEPPKPVQF